MTKTKKNSKTNPNLSDIKKAIKELGEKYRDLNNLEGEVNRLKGDIGLIQCYLERAVAKVEGTPYEGIVEA